MLHRERKEPFSIAFPTHQLPLLFNIDKSWGTGEGGTRTNETNLLKMFPIYHGILFIICFCCISSLRLLWPLVHHITTMLYSHYGSITTLISACFVRLLVGWSVWQKVCSCREVEAATRYHYHEDIVLVRPWHLIIFDIILLSPPSTSKSNNCDWIWKLSVVQNRSFQKHTENTSKFKWFFSLKLPIEPLQL